MEEIFCPQCRLQQPTSHRWCVSCGEELPAHLLPSEKVARFFAGMKVGDNDPEHGYLRVSCYRREHRIVSDEGSVAMTGDHVRVSMWVDDEAKCVRSLPSSEAREMAAFILNQTPHRDPSLSR